MKNRRQKKERHFGQPKYKKGFKLKAIGLNKVNN